MTAPHLTLRQPKPFFSEAEWLDFRAQFELSPRELQLVRMIFDDETKISMAKRLGTSANTVHKQLQRLYAKLEVRTRVGVVLRIVGERLSAAQANERGRPTVLPAGLRRAA